MMDVNEKLCITTYVFGDYISYIPAFIFFAKHTYPHCHPLIFIHDNMDPNTRAALGILEKHVDFTIKENYLPELVPQGQYGKAIRWVLWDDTFFDYEAVYIGDIDIFILPEATPLLEGHLAHCEVLRRPFSNIIRKPIRHPLPPRRKAFPTILRYPLQSIPLLVAGNSLPLRLSGLHFFKPKEYAPQYLTVRDLFLRNIKKKSVYLWHVDGFHNECFLYDIMTACGWIDDRFICEMMLEENESFGQTFPMGFHYRPHHGLHIGIFRDTQYMGKGLSIFSEAYRGQLCSPEYQAFFKYFSEVSSSVPLYNAISPYFSQRLKSELAYMEYIYSCSRKIFSGLTPNI